MNALIVIALLTKNHNLALRPLIAIVIGKFASFELESYLPGFELDWLQIACQSEALKDDARILLSTSSALV